MLRSKDFVNIEKTSAHARRDTGQEFELWIYLIFIQLRSQIHCYNLAENCVKHWCTHRSTILVGIPYPLLENRTWYYHSGTGTGSLTVTDPIVEAAGAAVQAVGLSQPKLWGRMSGATSNKRGRNSSSDTKGKIEQDRKRERPSSEMVDVGTMETVFEPERDDDLDAAADTDTELACLISGQKKMIQVTNDNFVRQSASLSQIIDRKIDGLRQELMDKMADQQRELEDLRARVQAVEARPSPADDGVTEQDLTPIYRRMEAVESSLATKGDVDRLAVQRLIVKGLPEAQDEGLEDLRQQCQQLMTELQLQIRMA